MLDYHIYEWWNINLNNSKFYNSEFSNYNKFLLIVVLEPTLESPMESKEINPANPKGSQPLIFIGRTESEAEALLL